MPLLKSRNTYVCNIKAILIFLVVLGHLLELFPDNKTAAVLYKFIYIFHMPLFVFLSGYYSRTKEACIKQIKISSLIFVICQPLFLLLNWLMTGKMAPFMTPFRHLWYIFALIAWSLIGLVPVKLKNKMAAVYPVILLVSVMAGAVPFADRTLSAQRIFAFLPYFCLGMVSDIKKVRKTNWLKFILLPVSAALCIAVIRFVPVNFLYQAVPYREGFVKGVHMRILCEAAAFSMIFFLLSVIPEKRTFFSPLGKDTLIIYIVHPLLIPMAEFMIKYSFSPLPGSILCAVWIILILYDAGKAVRPVRYLENGSG